MSKPKATAPRKSAKTPSKKRCGEPTPPVPAPVQRKATAAELLSQSGLIGMATMKVAAGEKFGNVDDLALFEEMAKPLRRISAGDMSPVEESLFMQAKTLEVVLIRMLDRAMSSYDHLEYYRVNMSMALRAQAQLRATLETLAEVKNPRSATFIRQLNAAEQQQVVNGQPVAHARAREALPPETELLQDSRHEQITMDPGATREGRRGNQEMATVGAQHGPADPRR